MKKLMTFAVMAALILAAGCAEIENKSATNEAPHAIGFTNYAPRALTKADGSYVGQSGSVTPAATLVPDYKFGVYAYSTPNDKTFSSALTDATAFMTGTVVKFADNNNGGVNNTYSPMRYWPAGDAPDKLTFWAYYPVTDATAGTIDNPTNGINYSAPTGSNGVGSYAFTAASSAADMVDFMVSDVVNDQLYSTNNGTVPLVFRHQLTKVQFKFKTTSLDASTTVKLLDAKLYKVKTSGTLSANYDASATPKTSTTWSDQALASTPVEYDVTFNSANPEISDNTTWIELGTTALPAAVGTENPAADIFLMVPQDMVSKTDATNAQYLEVTWEVTTGTGASAVTTRNSQKLYFKNDLKNGDDPSASGYAAADINWAKNNFITYIITIGPKPIYFTATVENWGAEQSGYFNVQ